jgi:hypothetical protein
VISIRGTKLVRRFHYFDDLLKFLPEVDAPLFVIDVFAKPPEGQISVCLRRHLPVEPGAAASAVSRPGNERRAANECSSPF